MAISKHLRFEVFKRDGFTCQYCGRRPPDVVLELDHIQPVAKGGGDEVVNLLTSCFDCNRGKRDGVLTSVAPKPDADLEFLAIQQEVAELRRFMAAKEQRDAVLEDVLDVLAGTWDARIGTYSPPSDPQFRRWLQTNTPEQIVEAIDITAPKYHSFWIDHSKAGAVKYVSGVLKRLRGGAD